MPEPGHKIYPYFLRGIEITQPNQVWAMDITSIPMAQNFVDGNTGRPQPGF
jgi:putative transposase